MKDATSPAVVVGGGLTGLALAYAMRERGVALTLVEERDEPGGNLRTRIVGPPGARWLLEQGPNAFGDAQAPIVDLAGSVGLGERIVRAGAPAGRRFIWRKGGLVEVPSKPQEFLTSPLLPVTARLRVGKEAFVKPRPAGAPEETLAQFADRRFGKVAREKLVAPFIGGIYAGDPERLGAESAFPEIVALERQYGSILGALQKGARMAPRGKLATFADGLRELPTAIVRSLGAHTVRLGTKVDRIERAGGAWTVVLASGERIESERVFVTSPAWRTADLLAAALPDVAAELRAIHYAPVVVVHAGFGGGASASVPAGFGFLVPRDESLRILGCVFSSQLFPGRAPEGHELFTLFVGGDLDPEAASLPDDAIRDLVLGDLRTAFGGLPEPSLFEITRWPRAIPQYEVGHRDRVARIEASVTAAAPGLRLLGNWRGGVAMESCIREAQTLAGTVDA